MQVPNIENKFKVKMAGKEIIFNVIAYRKLTDEEKTETIDDFLRNKNSKQTIRNYKNGEIVIQTIYGYNDPINPYGNF